MTYSQLLDLHFQISIEKRNLIQAMKTSSDVSLRDLYLLKVVPPQELKLQLIEADILETRKKLFSYNRHNTETTTIDNHLKQSA